HSVRSVVPRRRHRWRARRRGRRERPSPDGVLHRPQSAPDRDPDLRGVTNPRNAPEELWAPLNDPAFWAGDPAPHFARLRRAAPVVWNPVFGYWALAAHADVMTVSRDPA